MFYLLERIKIYTLHCWITIVNFSILTSLLETLTFGRQAVFSFDQVETLQNKDIVYYSK